MPNADMYINFCHSTTKTHNPQSAGGGGSIMPWGHLSVVHQVKAPLPRRLVKTHIFRNQFYVNLK